MNLSDHCDRCGAQAFVHLTFASGELMFCAHHFAKHEESIMSTKGAVIVEDIRHTINTKPSISASV